MAQLGFGMQNLDKRAARIYLRKLIRHAATLELDDAPQNGRDAWLRYLSEEVADISGQNLTTPATPR